MKSKKLLISLAVVAFVIVVIVVMIAVFAVKSVEVRYHDFSGGEIVATEGNGVVPDDILAMIKGKSTVFLSKTDLIDRINAKNGEWHAFAVVKNFPNSVEVHLVKRTIIAKMDTGVETVYIDSFGYRVAAPTQSEYNYIDLSSAFESTDMSRCKVGEPIVFEL